MPIFDVRCPNGHETEFIGASTQIASHRCECGESVERLWRVTAAHVVDDSIPGGLTIENMTARPETFYSKSDHRRRMQELGLRPRVQHVGERGSDKSRQTSRWT